MLNVLNRSWPLLLGIFLLMVGNGLQSSLLGVRGTIEGFSTIEMSFVMSAYFLGFLGGSRLAPELIRRVGHVRVFAALASFISAILILYPTLTDPVFWILLRVLIGFCFSGVYVTAESWLNNAATNQTRGQTMSLYLVVQMGGMVAAQGLLASGDPTGFVLFIIPSVLVSISFAPILLSATPTLPFGAPKAMPLARLFQISPLGVIGIFLIGGVFSALFGMGAVFGAEAGLSVAGISVFVATIYAGSLVLQFPLGWLSDRTDRRWVILGASLIAAGAASLGLANTNYVSLLVAAFWTGGMSIPLYGLLIAHTNDFLEVEDMAAASGRLIFVNGLGAVSGPLVAGALMSLAGPSGYWLLLLVLLLVLGLYTIYRKTRREAPDMLETGITVPVMAGATPVALEAAQEVYREASTSQDVTEREQD